MTETTKPMRERRRLATIDGDDDWRNACREAYAVMCQHVPVLRSDHITAIEPHGQHNGRFEWRTYYHSEDGFETVYVAVTQAPTPVQEPEDESSGRIDMDKVVQLLNDVHGVTAYVEQTGGGVAAIYAGEQRHPGCDCTRPPDAEHAAYCAMQFPADRVWSTVAGPGSYGWNGKPSVGWLDDFYVGIDSRVDEEAPSVEPRYVAALTEEDIARLIAAQTRKPWGTVLSGDDLESLGFDSSMRGLTRDDREKRLQLGVAAKVAADYLNGVLDTWQRLDVIGRSDDGYPFAKSFDEVVADMYAWADRLRGVES